MLRGFITETYAFLPREAVTRFLLGCTECQKHPRSPSPVSVLPTPSPSPTLPLLHPTAPLVPLPVPQIPQEIPYLDRTCQSPNVDHLSTSQQDAIQSPLKKEDLLKTNTPEPKRSSNPLDVSNLTSRDPPRSPAKKRHLNNLSETPKLWSPIDSLDKEQDEPQKKKRMLMAGDIDYSLPITTTYLKYMRTLGCRDEDALKFDNKHVSLVIEHFLHETISHYFH
ncbi:hypothetical protein NQ314_018145 [Rhamnusium bicolor]|uniref:Integrase zinc-binding domain-containing protein n=1 Tax=Rhamnusium bicolor TaxID=1586634 RepID=A0AAV8WSQ9_9CUCU|nr:hypothetical protein NQ314_018145 [Rhamnusium bicolor]